MNTKFVTYSRVKAGNSPEYRQSWIGVQAFWTSYEGDEILGTITHWEGSYPVVTFNDGTHGRLDTTFRKVVSA